MLISLNQTPITVKKAKKEKEKKVFQVGFVKQAWKKKQSVIKIWSLSFFEHFKPKWKKDNFVFIIWVSINLFNCERYFFLFLCSNLFKMVMAWSPTQDGIQQILQLLKESQSPDTQTQRAVQQVNILHVIQFIHIVWPNHFIHPHPHLYYTYHLNNLLWLLL